MIDLSSAIRATILADPIASDIAPYEDSKAIFTRRPAPTDAVYPMVFIGPQINGAQDDYVNGKLRRTVTYDILTYGQNDDPAKYRIVEKIGFAIAKKFARPTNQFFIAVPIGYSIVGAVGTMMMPAPTDDLNIVGRMSSLNITIEEL